ncbi:MAG: hypothetical protein ACREL5_00420 [Gemmatimonadales bacterium]
MRPIVPGDSTPTLVVKAVGVPGLVTAWITGDSVTKSWGDDSTEVPAYEWLDDLSARTVVVGVVPAPSDPVVATAQLQAETDSACALGWIHSSSLCSALHGFSDSDDSAGIGHYGATLDSARSSGGVVTDAAYYLLKPNVLYVLAHLPPPALGAYITGDTATSIFTAHVSGGVPSYTYLWEWCAIDCGGDDLRAPARPASGAVHPLTVEHGWHDVGTYTDSICWTMSYSTLRLTVTDADSSQVIAYYTVPYMEHLCS